MDNPVEAVPNSVPGLPPATLIYDDWYPAMRSDRLRGRKRQPRCCWASHWCWAARLATSCCHARQLPASRHSAVLRWFDDATGVTCRYHGWAFEPGHRPVPRDSLPYARGYAGLLAHLRHRISLLERDGYAWVYVPDAGPRADSPRRDSALPAVPELPKFGPRYRQRI